MSDNKTLKTYWEGRISNLEMLAIKSWLANGHNVSIYTYKKYNSHIKSFHDCMEVRDASEIIPVDRRWKVKGISTIFSDLFRYYLLDKLGGWWMDLDIVLLKPITTHSPIVMSSHFSEKEGDLYKDSFVNGAPLKIPRGHFFVKSLIKDSESFDSLKLNHASIGSCLISKTVSDLNLEQYVECSEVYSPVGYHEIQNIIKPGFGFDRITEKTVGIHLFNTSWEHGVNEKNHIDKNGIYHSDSLYEWLKKRYDVPGENKKIITSLSNLHVGPSIFVPHAIKILNENGVDPKNITFDFLPIKQLNAVEVELTTICNLKCINCDRRCRQAPSDEEISVQQIEHFIEETKLTNYPWRYVRILGGEPSLHKDFRFILELLLKGINAPIEVVSNGYGLAKEIESRITSGIHLKNTRKKDQYQTQFIHQEQTMLEKHNLTDIKSCSHVDDCGLGLTRYGFYPCGPGAAIDRVLGLDIGIKKLELVSHENIYAQMRSLCMYCGWSDSRSMPPKIEYEKMSPFWSSAYESYKKCPRVMRTYGS